MVQLESSIEWWYDAAALRAVTKAEVLGRGAVRLEKAGRGGILSLWVEVEAQDWMVDLQAWQFRAKFYLRGRAACLSVACLSGC